MKNPLRPVARPARLAALFVATLLAAGCGSEGDKRKKELEEDAMVIGKSDAELQREAAGLYVQARESATANDFRTAVMQYERLARRYPFTDFATQAQLERIYALYRSMEPEKAISAADKFLREHPRHPHADYVQYLKGVINFDRQTTFTDFLPFDDTRNDISYERQAFDDFALLVSRYPDSRYIGDARARMIHLRNRIAQHELAIVDFYMRRGAFLAAARRAEQIVAQYPGAPASYEVLGILEDAYREVGLREQAQEVASLRSAQGLSEAQFGARGRAGRPEDDGFDFWPFGDDEEAPPPLEGS